MPVPDRPAPDGRSTFVTDDGLHLFTQHWLPDGGAEAIQSEVLLVHGYGEHSGRYGHVARALNRAGAAVYTYDQRGYGRSEGRRAYVASFDRYLDDLDHFQSYLATQARMSGGSNPDSSAARPRFLYGHSMGGAVILLHALERRCEADGLILSSPAIEVNPDIAPLLQKAARFVGRIAPRLPTVRSPEGNISRDPDVVAEAEADPLNYHGRVLARTGAELLRSNRRIQAQQEQLTLPFLVFHGTADALTSPDASRRLYDRAASADKTIHVYDGLFHETHHEPERDQVLSDVAAWVADRS